MNRLLLAGSLSAVLLVWVMIAVADTVQKEVPFTQFSADEPPIGGSPIENSYSLWGLDQVVWMQVSSAITVFNRAASGHIGNYVYCFGGHNSNVGQVYNIATQQWEPSTPPLLGECNWCGVTVNESIYIIGRYDGSYGNEVQKFTPTGGGPTGTWEFMAPYPQSLCAITADWDGGSYIYAAGGNSSDPAAYRYDIAANVWEGICPMPIVMRYAGGAFVNGKFYMMGGTQTGTANTNYEYDPATDTWNQRAPIPIAVHFGLFSFTYNETYVMSIGGGGGYGSWPATNAVQLYDPVANVWIQEIALPQALGCNTGIWIGNGEVVSAGGYDGTNYRAEAYLGANFPGGIPPGILQGYVHEELIPHVPIEGAEVSVLYSSGTTDSTGFYRLDRIQEGTHEAVVTAFGYNTVQDSVVIVSDSITTMDFYLTQPLIEVDVTSIELALWQGVPHNEVFHIANNGNGPLEFEISIPGGGSDDPDEPWVWANPEQGTVEAGMTEPITVSFLIPDTATVGDVYYADMVIDNNSVTPQVIIPIVVEIALHAYFGSEGALPGEFALKQNYPNPFNPVTTISYDVPVAGKVRIYVYDVLGRRVGTLVDGLVNAGRHQVVWDAGGMTSGVYFVRMDAGAYQQVRKVELLR
ncbi:hypothetical protein AMJ86_04880 [bacterium SM23_57]|nr:MAG: hypothetical protein AMJ86_04880 [bacterium SM23_57]